MKTIKDKQLLVGADFAGYPLKEAVCAHLRAKGWTITDVGVTDPGVEDTENMFHRIGLRVGAMISEGEFERALIFCGTGMGIHIAASKCPHVHAGVVESVPAALRAITGNGVNVLAMGAFYVAPQMGCDIADAYLNAELGSGYEWWKNFYEFHKLAIDELEAFDYEEYKKNGFKMKHLGDYPLSLETPQNPFCPASRHFFPLTLPRTGHYNIIEKRNDDDEESTASAPLPREPGKLKTGGRARGNMASEFSGQGCAPEPGAAFRSVTDGQGPRMRVNRVGTAFVPQTPL